MKSKLHLKLTAVLSVLVFLSLSCLSSCRGFNDGYYYASSDNSTLDLFDSSDSSEIVSENPELPDTASATDYTTEDFQATMFTSIDLNVREAPNTESSVIGNIKSGSAVSVTGKCSNGWYRVNYNESGGYCFGKYLLAQTAAPTSLPQSEVDKSKPYYLKVNLTQNIITVYTKDETGEFTVPVKAMVCSVGVGGQTPVGTFKTSSKYVWHILKGDVYGQYCTRIVEHYLFHSVPCSAKDKGSLMYNKYNKLGTAASAGCIRLCVADAKWIFDNCPSGTSVTTYYSSAPEPITPPAPIRIDPNDPRRGWDPTDPDPANPWLAEQQ